MAGRFDIKTTKLTLSALRAYFRYLVRNDALARNPADNVKPPAHSYTRGETEAISAAENVISGGKPKWRRNLDWHSGSSNSSLSQVPTFSLTGAVGFRHF